MDWLQYAFLVIAGGLILTVGFIFLLWQTASARTRALAVRINRLPVSSKLRLAKTLLLNREVPLVLRLVPPALVLYLSLPLDLVPDFVPILGQADDLLVTAVGIAILVRFMPVRALESQLSTVEATDLPVSQRLS
jgi:uncharacterized membrane protein YkvA (DUF1232 family)